jgi:hypothetical protein
MSKRCSSEKFALSCQGFVGSKYKHFTIINFVYV